MITNLNASHDMPEWSRWTKTLTIYWLFLGCAVVWQIHLPSSLLTIYMHSSGRCQAVIRQSSSSHQVLTYSHYMSSFSKQYSSHDLARRSLNWHKSVRFVIHCTAYETSSLFGLGFWLFLIAEPTTKYSVRFMKSKVYFASVSAHFAPLSIAICLIRVQLVKREDVSGLIVMMNLWDFKSF